MHLILQGKCTSKELLKQKASLESWLKNIVGEIHMKVVGGPWVIEITNGKTSGLTGIVILAESHVSVHTFPESRYAFIDVFSCYWFHADIIKKIILENWGMKTDLELAIDRSAEGVI